MISQQLCTTHTDYFTVSQQHHTSHTKFTADDTVVPQRHLITISMLSFSLITLEGLWHSLHPYQYTLLVTDTALWQHCGAQVVNNATTATTVLYSIHPSLRWSKTFLYPTSLSLASDMYNNILAICMVSLLLAPNWQKRNIWKCLSVPWQNHCPFFHLSSTVCLFLELLWLGFSYVPLLLLFYQECIKSYIHGFNVLLASLVFSSILYHCHELQLSNYLCNYL